MKILLDEQIHTDIFIALKTSFEVYSIKSMGWKGLQNGELREKLNENNFTFLLCADKNIAFQQNIRKMNFTIILIDTPSLRAEKQSLFVPKIEDLLRNLPNPLPKMIHISIAEFHNIKLIEKLKNIFSPTEILFI